MIAIIIVRVVAKVDVSFLAKGLVLAHAKELALVVVQEFHIKHERYIKDLARRYGEEHHLHRHQRLPTRLQVLLPRREELESAYALGGSQASYRLYPRP